MKWRNSRNYLYLSVILVSAVVLRVMKLNHQLRPDEPTSVYEFGQMDIITIFSTISQLDPHPPLYYMLLRIWLEIFGHSIVTARAFSVVCSVLSVLGLYFLGSEIFDTKVGLTAAAIMTFSIFHITNGQTARMYPQFTVSIILSTLFLYRLHFDKTSRLRDIGGYALFTGVMLSTHLYSIFVFVSQIVAVLVSMRVDLRDRLTESYAASGFIGGIFLSLPSGFVMIRTVYYRVIRGGGDVSHANLPTIKYVLLTLGLYAGGEAQRLLAGVMLITVLILVLVSLKDYRIECVFLFTIAVFSFMIPIILALITEITFSFSPWDGRSALSLWIFLQLLSAVGYFRLRANYMWTVAAIWIFTTGGMLYLYLI